MVIIQMLIPDDKKPKFNVGGKQVTFPMDPEYITIHETANTAKGANDLAHARLQYNGNRRQASWHLQVDEDSCYQSLPFNEAGIHAGDGVNGKGNRKSIGIEICVNSDGDFEKAIHNASKVVAKLMKQFNIPSHKIVPHKHWSGKNCPARLLNGRWQEFINICIAQRGILEKGVSHVSERPLNEREKEIQAEAVRLGITDGKNPFREVNQMYVWACLIPLAQRIEKLEK
ncbi:N-acetylmuramoyl-L-alanine amidase family protein [Cytobacillus sp. FJAT-54145]|uniref:N-acetylmuramoyl-L-alanine amidase n=1 Tax=Cytobacillus spartinae TaxID=3299023 RepID=A0ABW6KIQ9_9BACI